jgi:hypothetical protein
MTVSCDLVRMRTTSAGAEAPADTGTQVDADSERPHRPLVGTAIAGGLTWRLARPYA